MNGEPVIEDITDNDDIEAVSCSGCGTEAEDEYVVTFLICSKRIPLCRNCSGTIALSLIRYWGVL